MTEAILNLIPLAVGAVAVVYWICSLATWDGTERCDEDCYTCPFPCERRNEKEK